MTTGFGFDGPAGRRVGDKVSVDDPKYPGVWIVTSTRGSANAKLEQNGRRLSAPYSMLTEPTEAAASVALPTLYNPGELVRINSGKWAGVWVVITDRGADKVNLAKLGGDGGHYLRATKRGLVKVSIEEAFEAVL